MGSPVLGLPILSSWNLSFFSVVCSFRIERRSNHYYLRRSIQDNMSAKHWCFTINNPTEEPKVQDYAYLVYGLEVGESGTPHYQGFVSMQKQTRLNAMSKMLPRAHLEVARGSPKQAADYCKKDGKFQEFGVLPVGKSTEKATAKRKADYQLAMDLAKKQKLYEIDPSMMIRFGSNLRQIARDHPPQLEDNDYLCGFWFYGPPGCGKSRSARWLFPGAYPKPLNKWWDGYQLEDYVIIDDIEPVHSVLGHHIKQWADHYPYTAEQKGTSIRIRPKAIIITSNYQIETIWASDWSMQLALLRRFKIINF